MYIELFHYKTILHFLNHLCGRHINISFSLFYWLLVVNRHSCQFVMPSAVKFLYSITLSISSSHFTSGCRRRRLPPSDQVMVQHPTQIKFENMSRHVVKFV